MKSVKNEIKDEIINSVYDSLQNTTPTSTISIVRSTRDSFYKLPLSPYPIKPNYYVYHLMLNPIWVSVHHLIKNTLIKNNI